MSARGWMRWYARAPWRWFEFYVIDRGHDGTMPTCERCRQIRARVARKARP